MCMGPNYWIRTDQVLAENGGKGPPCDSCGKPMYPVDDHGRFACVCDGYRARERLLRPLRRQVFR